jgi:hypothetical protein
MNEQEKQLTKESYIAYLDLLRREFGGWIPETEILLRWAVEADASADQIRYVLELLGKAEL